MPPDEKEVSLRSLRRLKLWSLGVGLLLATAGSGFMPAGAQAAHTYCFNSLAYRETCPPVGSSQWLHLELNAAWDPYNYGSAWTCIDEYLDPSGSGYYTTKACSYKTAEQYVASVWGYPRAWNGEERTHVVKAEEFGY
jgi:hypothetical protein